MDELSELLSGFFLEERNNPVKLIPDDDQGKMVMIEPVAYYGLIRVFELILRNHQLDCLGELRLTGHHYVQVERVILIKDLPAMNGRWAFSFLWLKDDGAPMVGVFDLIARKTHHAAMYDWTKLRGRRSDET